MLKGTIQINENIDISTYRKVIAFLKRHKDEYKPKKSSILSMDNVEQFLKEAPDNMYLFMKVVLIFGVNGACRTSELCNLMVHDVQDNGSFAIINLRNTKTKKDRIFTVAEECNGYAFYKKYAALRPSEMKHDRFFLYYKNNKCTSQPVGLHTFQKVPQFIAEFLNLPNSNKYTGHCLRRTSATLLADSGVEVQVLKRHGGWLSSNTAEAYVEDSIQNKMRTSKLLFKYASNENESSNINVVKQITQSHSVHHSTQSASIINSIKHLSDGEKSSNTKVLENITQCPSVNHATQSASIMNSIKHSSDRVRLSNIKVLEEITQSSSVNHATQSSSITNSIKRNADMTTAGSITISNISNCVFNIYNNNNK